MKIRRLNIKNFGKIHDKTLEFSPGINVLYGEDKNTGTTIYTFIKSMFFGLTKTKGKATGNDTYSIFEPKEEDSVYGGTLWFEEQKNHYRLTRDFQKDHPSGELLNEDSGVLCDAEKKNLEKVMGEISEAVYDNTVLVARLKSAAGQDLVRELQNYMSSYQQTKDRSTDLGRATQMLKMSRKGFQVQEDKKKKSMEQEQEKLHTKIRQLQAEIVQLRDKLSRIEEKEDSLHIRTGEENGGVILDEKVTQVRNKRNRAAMGMIFSAVAGILGLILAATLSDKMAVSIAVLAVAALLVIFCGMKQLDYARELQKRIRMKSRWLSRQEKLKGNRETLLQELDEKEMDLENLQEETQEYEEDSSLPTVEEQEIQALNIAMQTIERLSSNAYDQTGKRLQMRTSQILSELTGGKYQEIVTDENFHIMVTAGERTVGLERLSRETMEQIYFALQMAAGELLCQKEPFPVILDDILGMYEEDKLTAVLKWLHKQHKQVIISTSHKREMEILEKQKIPYQKLSLS